MKRFDCVQGSGEWAALRRGIPTASEFNELITPEWKPRTGQGPQSYLLRKVCENTLGFYGDGTQGGSWAMGQGSILEHEAIPWLEFEHSLKVDRVGFCTTDDGRIGCSPDGLIGEDGGVECKCPQPEKHLEYLLGGELPKEYRAQVHGSMFVTGRKWWLFMSYSRQFPALVIRVERDEAIIHHLQSVLHEFLTRFDDALDRVTHIRSDYNAVMQERHSGGGRGL